MTQAPKVSVILTSFNHAKYLREAIDSVLNQTFSDFELIIWDDASADESWEIIQSYSDPRIKSFRNEEQMRGIYGINKAISEVSQGEYIAIHHSDDVWEPQKLDTQVNFLNTFDQIGAVFTNTLAIDEDGDLLDNADHFYKKIFDQPNRTRFDWLRYFFTKGNALCHPSVLIRKTCYADCGLYRFGLAQLGDFDMWIRLCMANEIHVLPEKLVRFRVRDNEANTSGSRPESRIRYFYEYYKLLHNYRSIKAYDSFIRVFPEAVTYCDESNFDVDYALAMVCLELKPLPFVLLFAQDILFEAITNAVRADELSRKFGFNYRNFIAETGQHDVFSLEALRHDQAALTERDGQIASLNQTVSERDGQIASLNQVITECESKITKLVTDFTALKRSTSWRLTAPIRFIGHLLKGDFEIAWRVIHSFIVGMVLLLPTRIQNTLLNFSKKIQSAIHFLDFAYTSAHSWYMARGRLPLITELPSLVAKAIHIFRKQHSVAGEYIAPPDGFQIQKKEGLYTSWIRYNQWNPRRHSELLARLARIEHIPLISVVMPVFNPPLKYLEIAINSVIGQVYNNWELCIVDDFSSEQTVRSYLKEIAAKDSRIKILFREENGNISKATNDAVDLASGEFIAFLDNDDELPPDALAEVALYIESHPDVDYLYSDDDKIDELGNRFAPQFKPDWSPELLLAYMYCSHLVVVRRSLYLEIGGMRVGFEGAQDYDFALRATENARHIGHIPHVLYHWRTLPGSTAQSGNAKPASISAGMRAIEETLRRRGIVANVSQPKWAHKGGLGIFELDFPDEGPSVTIIVPTKNAIGVLKNCITSLKRTTYRNYDVIIVDNESDDPETLSFLENCGHRVLRIANPPDGFNYAYINNRAVAEASSEFVLFLNNDIEIKEPRWLSQMVGYAQISGVGAVGARLLYPDGRIQHAGIIHGYYKGMAGPAHKLLPSWHNGYLSYAVVSRNYLAVTAACLLMPKWLFGEIGGFDEKDFAVAYNDVDLCYRLVEKGYRCVYSPGSELVHYEGYSRGYEDKPAEEATFKQKYAQLVDPFYNANLSLENEQFDILARAAEQAEPLAPIKALMVAFNLNLEGAPFSQYELTVGLKCLGIIDPIVYCPEDGPLRSLYEDAGINVIVKSHPLRGVFDVERYSEAIHDFAEIICQLSIQVVYGNTLQTFYAIEAAHYLGVPSIWNPRESEPWQTYFSHFGDQIAAKALGCFAYPYRIIFVSDATRQGCEQLNSANNFATIYNGLDLKRAEVEQAKYSKSQSRRKLAIEKDELMVLMLGTVCERKGQIDLVSAVQKMATSKEMNHLRFFIVGDRKSTYSSKIHHAIEQLPHNIRDHISVVQETKDTALYLTAADIFICASRVESYPRVILEAMYYGLAIVTTPVFGIAEQLTDQISALFYSPGDTEKLADNLQRLVQDHKLRERLSVNSRLRLDRLTSYEEMLRQYADHFVGAYYSGAPSDSITFMRDN